MHCVSGVAPFENRKKKREADHENQKFRFGHPANLYWYEVLYAVSPWLTAACMYYYSSHHIYYSLHSNQKYTTFPVTLPFGLAVLMVQYGWLTYVYFAPPFQSYCTSPDGIRTSGSPLIQLLPCPQSSHSFQVGCFDCRCLISKLQRSSSSRM